MLDHQAALVVDGRLSAREAHQRDVAEVARGLPGRADAGQQAVELAEGDREARAEDPQRVGPVARRDGAQQGVGQGDVEDGVARVRFRDEIHGYSCTKTVLFSR